MTMEAKKVEETRALVQQATTLLRDHLLQAPQLLLSRGEQQTLRTTLQLLLPSLAIVRSYETQHMYRCVYTTVEGAVAQVLNSTALSESDMRDVAKAGEEGGRQLVVPAPEAASQDASLLATSGSPREEAKDVAKAPEAPQPCWKDVYGCADAILALRQATTLPLRFPALFTGPRRPWRRLLLYGPPGTGKTQLAAATAAEYGAVFLSVSAADLLSKWVGESEKQVRQAFARAAAATPRCVLFFDEIDALCSARGGHGESEVARRLKTEFLLHLQTAAPSVLVLAATNMPWELDAAIARRFERFIHVGLPTRKDKLRFLCDEMRGVAHVVTRAELRGVVRRMEGFSLVDVRRVLTHAVMAPVAEWLGTKAPHRMGDDADGCAAAQRERQHGRRRCVSNGAAAVSTWVSPFPPPPPTSYSRQRASRKVAGGVMATVAEGVLGGIRSKSAEGEDTPPQRCSIPPHRENTPHRDSSTLSSSISPADTRSDADVVSSRSTSAEVFVCAADAPPVEARHFEEALRCVAATSSAADIARYAAWTSRVS